MISIGDSITAGFGMTTGEVQRFNPVYHSGLTRVVNADSDLLDVLIGRPPFAILLERRGKVFSDGGDSNEYTLANFLKTYSKHIRGSPSGFTLPLGKRTYPLFN